MAGKTSRNKGQRGEREVIAILQPIVNRVYADYNIVAPVLQRNLMQTMEGGCDIIGLDDFAIEVKRCETFCIPSWWRQTLKQTKKDQIPVLFYRKNWSGWRVKHKTGDMIFDTGTLKIFLEWFEGYLRTELKSKICN